MVAKVSEGVIISESFLKSKAANAKRLAEEPELPSIHTLPKIFAVFFQMIQHMDHSLMPSGSLKHYLQL